MSWYRWDGQDLVVRVRVQPRASKDEVAGLHGDRLKIRLKSPPVDGRANMRLLRFIAGLFGVRRAAVKLESGARSREKDVRVSQPRLTPEQVFMP